MTLPLAVPPETPIRKGLFVSWPLILPLNPADIFLDKLMSAIDEEKCVLIKVMLRGVLDVDRLAVFCVARAVLDNARSRATRQN